MRERGKAWKSVEQRQIGRFGREIIWERLDGKFCESTPKNWLEWIDYQGTAAACHFQQSEQPTAPAKMKQFFFFLATLVALHFTPVSEWVGDSFGLA